MEDKNKALQQLDNIHGSLIDSEDQTPLDANIILVWAVASAIMFLGFEVVLGFGMYYSILFILGVNALAYGVDIFMIRRENDKYDIANMTHNQTITKWHYNISIIFAIILTLVFNHNGLGNYSYPSWVFLIAFSNFNTGLLLNKSSFKFAGIFGLIVGAMMFFGLLYVEVYDFIKYYKFISVVACSGSLVYITVMLKRG